MKDKLYRKIILLFSILMLTSCSNNKISQYRAYGIDNLENNHYEEALEYFDKAISLGNGEVGNTQYELLRYKAECLFMLKRYKESKNIYELLLKIDKNNKLYNELYNNVGSIVNLVEFKNAIDNGEITDSFTPKELANNVTGMLTTHILDRRITYHKKTFKQEFMENLDKWLNILKCSDREGEEV